MAEENKDGKLEISQGVEILKPMNWKGFSISFRDWNRIKAQAEKIMPPKNYWQISGSVLLGVSATAGFGYLTSPENKTICFISFIISLIVGIFCFIVDAKNKKISEFSKEQLMKEINEVDEMCEASLGNIGAKK